jgi:ubiquinone biosynthesis protein
VQVCRRQIGICMAVPEVKSKRVGNGPTLIGRYEQVIGILFKYGFADVIAHPPFNRFLPKSRKFIPVRKGKAVTDFTRYERIRMVCEELGTTYIKFAQIASNRPDLLPTELLSQLSSFQDHAPEVPAEIIRTVFLEEFGELPENLFQVFDYRPVASASMAQVHRAVRMDGVEVALKVLRPGIREVVEMDIQILNQLAHLIENYFPEYASFQPVELVKMFETSIRKELHLRMEATNLVRFGRNFRGHPDVLVPRYYPEHSTDRILCMDFIRGYKITDLVALAGIGLNGPVLALKGINIYFEQVFDHGFFHADPHPGNIFVLEDQRICFVDYGMMGLVLESDKILMANLLIAIADKDVQGLKRALLKFAKSDKLDAAKDKELEYDISEFLTEYSGISLEDIEGMEVMNGVNRLFFTYKVRVPPNLLLLLKALVIIEGVGLHLDPRYNIIENITPFVRRLLARRYSPARMGQNLLKAAGDMVRLAGSLPEDVMEVMRKVRQGRLHIEFEHKGLEPLIRELDMVSNRLSFAIIIAAMILGSSLLVLAHVPPFIYNISALGFTGFVISGLLALRLAWAIIKHGNL